MAGTDLLDGNMRQWAWSRKQSACTVALLALLASIATAGCGNGQLQSANAERSTTTTTATTTSTSAAPTSAAPTSTTTVPRSSSTTAPGPALARQTSNGVSLDIPVGWEEKQPPADGSIGDHWDVLFTARNDPADQLLIIESNEAGAQNDPPVQLVPTGGANAAALSPTSAGFDSAGTASSLSSYWDQQNPGPLPAGYRTDGIVTVGSSTDNPVYAIVAVTLPASEHSTASEILNSAKLVQQGANSGAPAPPSGPPPANSGASQTAFQQLQGTWGDGQGTSYTFQPTGQPNQLTIAGLGGTATPGPTQTVFTGVNAGGGQVTVTYNFAQDPNTITWQADLDNFVLHKQP